ncbi:MAG: three-Cys-motif partner protein TcmP [Acidobacteria bacterium]|nr:three-Cys-motif partner protein TcmP [Acidobacteriota bacterium]MBU4494278.1 three-Cys-motif partner protein TcmP [Acidobacteriota bacterium]
MTIDHRFGGAWTQEKLTRLSKYLTAYTRIFHANEQARWYTTHYVDAFAGSGFRSDQPTKDSPVFVQDEEAAEFLSGSATIALEVDPTFNKYWFVDRKPDHVNALNELKARFPDRIVTILQDDANHFLREWCRDLDWKKNRAVVFLDPYGAQVEWPTIQDIAGTNAIDLWLLFPLGQAVNRMLTRHEPNASWAKRLDRLFGTQVWRDEFYRRSAQASLFEDSASTEKVADFNSIGKFFIARLQSVFAEVSKSPLALFNSKNVPIYLLCFASANPKGGKTAVKIANHILRS